MGGGERRDKNRFIQIRDQCAKKDGRSEAGRGGMRVGERGRESAKIKAEICTVKYTLNWVRVKERWSEEEGKIEVNE